MEAEIVSIKNQVVIFENELNHLKSLEDKYKFENSDLQMRIDGESGKNHELNATINEPQVNTCKVYKVFGSSSTTQSMEDSHMRPSKLVKFCF
jgi:hypothetical protein